MKKIVITLILSLGLHHSSFGRGNDFGGGFAVKSISEYQLFDFYEHQLTSFSNPKTDDYGNFAIGIAKLNFPKPVSDGLIYKLNEIYLKSTEFANHLFFVSTSFSWVFVNSDLKRIEDVGNSLVDTSRLALVPLALRNRESRTIFISKEYFEKLSVEHQIGLILHEVLSHYILDSTSTRARKLTSYLFTNEFSNHSFEQMENFIVSLGEIITDKFTYTEGHFAVSFTWGKPSTNYQAGMARYVSFQNFNPKICEQKIATYGTELQRTKNAIESAWAITNDINQTIRENELLRFKPENLAYITFVINPAACKNFETNTYDCNGWLSSKSSYYVNHYDPASKTWVKEQKVTTWKNHYDFDSLLSQWIRFEALLQETLNGSDYRCGFSTYDLFILGEQIKRNTISEVVD